jgi:hypothetical protein
VTPSIEISPDKFSACIGDIITFSTSVKNAGQNPQYQWYVNNLKIDNSQDSLVINNLNNGDQVYCKLISDEICTTSDLAYSNTVSIAFNPIVTPAIDISTTNANIIACDEIKFVANTIYGGAHPVIDWYVNNVYVSSGLEFISSNLRNEDLISSRLKSSLVCIATPEVLSNQILLSVSPLPQPLIGTKYDTIYCENYHGDLYSFRWFYEEEEVSSDSFLLCRDFGNGSYFVIVNKKSCSNTSLSNYITCSVGTHNQNTENSIKIYPNPSKGNITIKGMSNSNYNTISVKDCFG